MTALEPSSYRNWKFIDLISLCGFISALLVEIILHVPCYLSKIYLICLILCTTYHLVRFQLFASLFTQHVLFLSTAAVIFLSMFTLPWWLLPLKVVCQPEQPNYPILSNTVQKCLIFSSRVLQSKNKFCLSKPRLGKISGPPCRL